MIVLEQYIGNAPESHTTSHLHLGIRLITEVFLLLCTQQTHNIQILCTNKACSSFYISINISLVKGIKTFSFYEEAL